MKTIEQLAQEAFEKAAEIIDRDRPPEYKCNAWDELRPDVKEAWAAAARHIVEATSGAKTVEPEQEPVAVYEETFYRDYGTLHSCGISVHLLKDIPVGAKLYTSPQPREWQDLTKKELVAVVEAARKELFDNRLPSWELDDILAKHIAASLRAKNECAS